MSISHIHNGKQLLIGDSGINIHYSAHRSLMLHIRNQKKGFDLLNLTPRIPPSSPVILTESVKANVNGNATISKDSSDSSTTTTTTMNIVSEEEDNVPCNICGLTGDTPENPALLCETCITGCAHIRCLNLKKVPEGLVLWGLQ